MAQQDLIIGAADAQNGDTYFSAFTKTQANFTDIYEQLQSGNNTVYLYSEDDLPNKTATTWTMEPNTPYEVAASFSTDLQCIPNEGASLFAHNLSAYVLTFTGTSSTMFKGTDVDFFIHDITVDAGLTNTCFEFNDTLGSKHRFISQNMIVKSCGVWGKFTDMLLVQPDNCNGDECLKGVQLFGTAGTIWSFNRMALTSSSAGFIGVDMGSATATIAEFDDIIMTAPAGAVGFSGLASSGNIPSGRLGRIFGCEFIGGMTDLQNITVDDVRWSFRDNTPTRDTLADALLFISTGATTTITTAGVYVKVNATWSTETISQFSADASGQITWLGERPNKTPVDISLSMAPSAGTNKTLRSRIAVNGVTVPNSERSTRTDSGDASSVTTPWQLTLQPNDYIEAFVTSDDATDVAVTSGIMRIN